MQVPFAAVRHSLLDKLSQRRLDLWTEVGISLSEVGQGLLAIVQAIHDVDPKGNQEKLHQYE